MSKTYLKKVKLLNLTNLGIDDLSKDAQDWIDDQDTSRCINRYIAIGFAPEKECKSMSHGALVVFTTDGGAFGFEYGNLTAVGKKEVKKLMSAHTHPNGDWFTCEMRSQRLMKEKGVKCITLGDVLVNAELWKEEMPYLWNKTSYPNNCYGYVDSAIISVFGDTPISKDAIRWKGL